jgi:hypothetical protein
MKMQEEFDYDNFPFWECKSLLLSAMLLKGARVFSPKKKGFSEGGKAHTHIC